MKLRKASIRNFRRLEDIEIEFDEKETVFVGPNNSGKTSATAAFRCFLSSRDFKIHDFSVSNITEINALEPGTENADAPEIQLDLWFRFDPNSIAFGRAFALLPNISEELNEIGIRCAYSVDNLEELWTAYNSVFPIQEDGTRKQSMSHFLGLDGVLKRHFSTKYSSLEVIEGEVDTTDLDPKEGRRILGSLLRVDFIDAQRNIDDEEVSRSNKLSKAFGSFYKSNLNQAKVSDEAIDIIDGNNQRLTDHYETNFSDLMGVIKGLGVPSANDRELKVVSTISAETALQGNTDLMYIDDESKHELPEAYNGLGFKNLVFMAVQARHFHLQWANTPQDRPLCHIIFIEEPEVHLHAQVQQTFISNMWNVLKGVSKPTELAPQLAITTHSSHILDAVEFGKVRYFRRCSRKHDDPKSAKILNASEVHDLQKFQPEPVEVDGKELSRAEILKFLKRYLTLTHCDLFFADSAILVEGTVEKLLMPSMITKCAPGLSAKYLTTLEVGGAYAHRFAGLLEFLHIPYVVLTDIDSVEFNKETKRYNACSTDQPNAVTSNPSLKHFFPGKVAISELSELKEEAHVQIDNQRYVSFQKSLMIRRDKEELILHGRTLEESFIHENLDLIENGKLEVNFKIPTAAAEIAKKSYDHVQSSSFKKTDFALRVLSSDNWNVPSYITSGLTWLETRLETPIDSDKS
jgi:putative ATP-dependent endonuclease of OLD family